MPLETMDLPKRLAHIPPSITINAANDEDDNNNTDTNTATIASV